MCWGRISRIGLVMNFMLSLGTDWGVVVICGGAYGMVEWVCNRKIWCQIRECLNGHTELGLSDIRAKTFFTIHNTCLF